MALMTMLRFWLPFAKFFGLFPISYKKTEPIYSFSIRAFVFSLFWWITHGYIFYRNYLFSLNNETTWNFVNARKMFIYSLLILMLILVNIHYRKIIKLLFALNLEIFHPSYYLYFLTFIDIITIVFLTLEYLILEKKYFLSHIDNIFYFLYPFYLTLFINMIVIIYNKFYNLNDQIQELEYNFLSGIFISKFLIHKLKSFRNLHYSLINLTELFNSVFSFIITLTFLFTFIVCIIYFYIIFTYPLKNYFNLLAHFILFLLYILVKIIIFLTLCQYTSNEVNAKVPIRCVPVFPPMSFP